MHLPLPITRIARPFSLTLDPFNRMLTQALPRARIDKLHLPPSLLQQTLRLLQPPIAQQADQTLTLINLLLDREVQLLRIDYLDLRKVTS